MPASGASLDRNWLLGLLGLGEKGASISDHNIKTWLQILFLTLVIGFCCLLYQLAEDRESNHSVNEVDELDEFDNFYESWEREQEHPNGQLDRYFDEEDSHRTTVSGGGDGRRDGGCAFCGNFTTTRCSRCKSARYCSMKCQIIHWRSIHKYECYESKIAADKAKTTDNERTSEVVENSEMESASNASTVEDRVLWSPESDMAVKVSSGNHVNNLNGCKLCAKPSTTRCSRCKAVQYWKTVYINSSSSFMQLLGYQFFVFPFFFFQLSEVLDHGLEKA
ncbi:Ubiquitin carboxyl-terminal hydrolase [Vigna angularis]|uniref:Ubiquitin carboxyl-terminal hydrolase n=1 Tax=Phaseolus angularis TaxID=3914 RepID=A0A8T0KBT3_PHAAN|nr:Ubiquitin carboxyl-terminal hydrolase [Vigna angularis]